MKKCAYCNKEIIQGQEVKATITFRTRNEIGRAIVGKKQNEYCSNKCASYDQFAHEG